jgi:hypothetical protein
MNFLSLISLILWFGLPHSLNTTNVELDILIEPNTEVKSKLPELEGILANPIVFELDATAINQAAKAKRNNIRMELAISGWPRFSFAIEENELRAPDYQSILVTEKGEISLPRTPCNTYKGTESAPGHTVRMTIGENGIRALIQDKGIIYRIEPAHYFGVSKDLYIAYTTNELQDLSDISCEVQHSSQEVPGNDAPKNIGNCPLEMEIATDSDYEYYQIHGANANQQILSDLNFVEIPFENSFNMQIVVTYQRMFSTSNDPHTQTCVNASSTGCANVINEIRSLWNGSLSHVRRDVAHFFTGKSHSANGHVGNSNATTGSGIGTVCLEPHNANGFTRSFTDSYLTTAHELGHNFDAWHHDDGTCETTEATLMCAGSQTRILEFATYSENQIQAHIDLTTCLDPCHNLISSFPYQEGFESSFGDWIQGPLHDFDWRRNSDGTYSNGTGPSSAYEGSFYAYVEASYPHYPNKETVLWGPCFDFTNLDNPVLTFRYHMYGHQGMGALKVYVKDNSCGLTEVFNMAGNQGNQWHLATIDLSAYAGETIQIKMMGTTTFTYQGDIAVDDILVTNTCPPSLSIVENIPACYPSFYPHGRYVLSDPYAGSVQWSGTNVNFMSSTSSPTAVVAPTSSGWFTLYANVDCGNGGTTFLSQSFYASNCGFIGDNSDETQKQFTLYPIPASEALFLTGPELEENISVSILDLNGREILQQRLKDYSKSINIQSLENGIYFLKIKGNNYYQIEKIEVLKQ